MSSTRRSTVGRRLLVALLVVVLVVLLLGFWPPTWNDIAAEALTPISLLGAVLVMGLVLYRRLATGLRRPDSVLRDLPPDWRDMVRKAWRGDAKGVPPALSDVTRRYAGAQTIVDENSALLAAGFGLIWVNQAPDSVVGIALRVVIVCFVALGLYSVWKAGRWRRLTASLTANA